MIAEFVLTQDLVGDTAQDQVQEEWIAREDMVTNPKYLWNIMFYMTFNRFMPLFGW